MGLDIRTAEFLLHCRAHGVDFSDVCTLGRQALYLSPLERRRLSRWLGGIETRSERYAEFFFRELGSPHPMAMDSSHYEGADVIFNLNDELPGELRNRWSCLIDGGTLEHVFDIARSMRSCMQMVKVGGHLIVCQMANNCMGHGFYQFSPEFFCSTLTPENGYELKFLALHEGGVWYEARSPREAHQRIQAQTRGTTLIYAVAKRISDVTPFAQPPHQSDYESNLGVTESQPVAARSGGLRRSLGKIKERYLPWLWDLQIQHNRRRLERLDSLNNPQRFRRIGRALSA